MCGHKSNEQLATRAPSKKRGGKKTLPAGERKNKKLQKDAVSSGVSLVRPALKPIIIIEIN